MPKLRSVQTRVYRYRCLDPERIEPSGTPYTLSEISRQLDLAFEYRRELAELERLRRKEISDILSRHLANYTPDLDQLLRQTRSEVSEIKQQIKRHRQRSRSRKNVPKELLDALKDAQQRLRELAGKARETKKLISTHPEVRKAIASINARHNESIKELRKHYSRTLGLYHSNYVQVEREARSRAKSRGRVRIPSRRFLSLEKLSIQIVRGLPVSALFDGNHPRVRITSPEPLHHRTPRQLPPGTRPPKPLHRLWFRIASFRSNGRRRGTPVWAVFPVILHRDMPRHGLVKWVHLVRERVGFHKRWWVHFVVDLPQGEAAPQTGHGTVAVDIGWRQLPDGRLRVAVALDEQGNEHQLCLPADLVEEFHRVNRLRSAIDKRRNSIRKLLLWLYDKHPHTLPNWPDLPDIMQRIRTSKTGSHTAPEMRRFVRRWLSDKRNGNPTGSESALDHLSRWLFRKELHLIHYAAHLEDQLRARRTDVYRNWAALLRRRYDTVVVEQFNLRQAAMVKDRYFSDLLPDAARWQRCVAALSTLRRILADSGLRTVSVPAAYSTATCSWCGAVDRLWEHCGELYHTCPHCGRTWDRDINAVRNLLRRYREAQTPQHT